MPRIRSIAAFALASLLAALTCPAAAAAEATPPEGWLAQARDAIESSEYHFAVEDDGAVSAPNRVHDLRIEVRPAGVEVLPRTDGGPRWRLRLEAARWGRTGALEELSAGLVRADGPRVVLARGAVEEIYLNGPAGLEQLFEVPVPPGGAREAGPLVIEMRLGGDVLGSATADGASVLFRSPGGAPVAMLSHLRVLDATDHEVPARLRVSAGILAIEVDDADAVYPLHVDPLLTSPSWTTESNQVEARFGTVVATAGDVNGDGFSDVLVGAPLFDGGQTDEGRVFLYLGSAAGLSATASRFFEQNQASAHFGESLSTAGDLEGDGNDDFMIGAPDWDTGAVDTGAVFFYLGGSPSPDTVADVTRTGGQTAEQFGQVVAWAGDVDRDFKDDVIIGAPFRDGAFTNEGRAVVYYGDTNDILRPFDDWQFLGGQAEAHFAGAVGTAGDVNGDGYDDVIVGADDWNASDTLTNVGKVFVFHGSTSGLSVTPSWEEVFSELNAHFGSAVGTAGDVNGNGYADVVIGAYVEDSSFTDEGSIWIYSGSATGLGAAAVSVRRSGEANARMGSSAATAGDVNGDGFADVIASAYLHDAGGIDRGRAYVWCGTPTGTISSSPCWSVDGAQDDADFGWSVAPAGDVNGDGYSDVLVGARLHDAGQTNEGRAFLYLGSGDGPVTTPSKTLRPTTGAAYEDFGWSVASAGDVNGDGFSDVLVSDPQFGAADNGAVFVFLGTASGPSTSPTTTLQGSQLHSGFGESIDGAGDVNGDGYDDVVVGAPHWDTAEDDENGRVFVFHGGAAGVDATADFQNSPATGIGIFDQRVGESVAGAGDVNGDGFGDIVVGGAISPNRAYVYYGSPTGVTAPPGTSGLEGENVASAGDVNGDGFSDVLTFHTSSLDDEWIYLYLGGGPTIDTTADWTRTADFEANAGPAGDVNADGFSDVVVHLFSQTSGGDHLYLGGPGGLGATPDQTLAFDASRSGTAGDVNGDGHSDVFGQQFTETVQIYFGSGTGLAATAGWNVSSPSPGDGFAKSFAGAGDTNGDGFDDVVVGAPDTNGNNAQLYFGGGGDGLDRLPRQRRVGSAVPISLLGSSDLGDQFKLRAIRRHPGGRDTVGLRYETAPLGQPFGSGPSGETVQIDTGAPGPSGSATDTERLVTGLAPETVHRWRVRLFSNNPFFRGSKWLSVPGNAVTETDFRTTCLASTWYRDQDVDTWGNAAVSQSACAQPAGYVARSGDCNDADPAMFPGNAELCDGKDNDCNGTSDDGFPAPSGRPSVFAKKGGTTSVDLFWEAVSLADRYDVTRGGLGTLRSTAGNFTDATQLCLADDLTSKNVEDAEVPPGGDGFWYVLRPVNCTSAGTYDSPGRSQVGSRDAEIDASSRSCP